MNKKVCKFLACLLLAACIFSSCSITNFKAQDEKVEEVKEEFVEEEVSLEKENDILKEEVKETDSEAEISITCFGDYMNHITQIRDAERNNYDFTDSFVLVKDLISQSDLSFVNLETTIAESEDELSGYPNFATHENVIRAIKDTGFDVLSTANNHSMDKGFSGIDNTIDKIEENSLKHTGTFKDGESTDPLILDVKGIKIGFFSATERINGLEGDLLNSDRPYSVNLIDTDKIEKDVDYLKDQGVDIIMAYLHWGDEYSDEVNYYQRETAQSLADLGVDIIIGSHPHTIEKDEVIETNGKKTYVTYSLGNFVSDQRESYGQYYGVEIGVYTKIKIKKQVGKTEVISFENKPYYVDKYTDDVTTRYVVVPIEELVNGEIDYARKDIIAEEVERAQDHYERIFQAY
ncbi:MAG: CapA family protein [Finegoldia sp.]|nr:CapA family protein [Finegoldia sp.]